MIQIYPIHEINKILQSKRNISNTKNTEPQF